MESLFREELKHEQAMLPGKSISGRVGAFEGAMYEAKGYYRPEIELHYVFSHEPLCVVCRKAIERIIDLYSVKPMNGAPLKGTHCWCQSSGQIITQVSIDLAGLCNILRPPRSNRLVFRACTWVFDSRSS